MERILSMLNINVCFKSVNNVVSDKCGIFFVFHMFDNTWNRYKNVAIILYISAL
jgi:hypothetical protein